MGGGGGGGGHVHVCNTCQILKAGSPHTQRSALLVGSTTHSGVVGEQGDWSSSTDTGKVETFSGKVVEEDVCVW